MGFQCSIFGHKYGDVQSERERRENDNEVIITVRETKTCTRCGETMVVSENKEIRTVETATDAPVNGGTGRASGTGGTETPQPSPDVGAEVIDSSQATDEDATDTSQDAGGSYTTGTGPDRGADGDATGQQDSDTPPPGPGGDGASRRQDSEDETETYSTGGGIPDAETGEEMAESLGDGPPPRKDDAEILNDEDEREPGEWPDDWEDEADDGGVEPPGEWPEETTADANDWQPEAERETADEEADDTDEDEAVGDEEPEIEPTRDALTVPEGEFYCPDCRFATRVEDSSLREGDFCPQCHEAALEHRAD